MKRIGTVIVAGVLLSASAAFAQDSFNLPVGVRPVQPPPAARDVRANIQNLRTERLDIKSAVKDVRESFQTRAKTLRENTEEKLKEATSSAERRDVLRNTIEERKSMIEDRRATTTALRAKLSELARRHLGLVNERYTIALNQFDGLAARIQSRIDKLTAAGIDASSTGTLLAAAQTAIAQAKADVQAVRDFVAQITDATDPKTAKQQLDAGVKRANASIQAAHKALIAAANDLVKAARSANRPKPAPVSNATSTEN